MSKRTKQVRFQSTSPEVKEFSVSSDHEPFIATHIKELPMTAPPQMHQYTEEYVATNRKGDLVRYVTYTPGVHRQLVKNKRNELIMMAFYFYMHYMYYMTHETDVDDFRWPIIDISEIPESLRSNSIPSLRQKIEHLEAYHYLIGHAREVFRYRYYQEFKDERPRDPTHPANCFQKIFPRLFWDKKYEFYPEKK